MEGECDRKYGVYLYLSVSDYVRVLFSRSMLLVSRVVVA